VPKFLVNKWLNIGQEKSKFVDPNCQLDNKDDVSVYSESNFSKFSSPKGRKFGRVPKFSKFSNSNLASKIFKNDRSEAISQFDDNDSLSRRGSTYKKREQENSYPRLLNVKPNEKSMERSHSLQKKSCSINSKLSESSIGLDLFSPSLRKINMIEDEENTNKDEINEKIIRIHSLIVEAKEDSSISSISPKADILKV